MDGNVPRPATPADVLSAAALAEGRRVILVERDPRFAEIARQRCAHATPDISAPVRVPARAMAPAPAADPRQRSLFDLLAGVR